MRSQPDCFEFFFLVVAVVKIVGGVLSFVAILL